MTKRTRVTARVGIHMKTYDTEDTDDGTFGDTYDDIWHREHV